MKKRSAFTIFEVLLAIGILVFAVSIIARLQMRSLSRMLRDHDDIEKIFLIKKELYTIFLRPPMEVKKTKVTLEDPEMSINIRLQDIQKKSKLARFSDSIRLVYCLGTWKYENNPRDSVMVALIPKPEPKKEEK